MSPNAGVAEMTHHTEPFR